MKKYLFLLIFIATGFCVSAQQQAVPYTLADRDRLIQVEASVSSLRHEMNSLRHEMNARFEAVDQRFEAMDQRFEAMDAKFEAINAKIDYIFWLPGALFAQMIFMLGFIIWDRRTTLAPVKMEIEELKRANEKMKEIFIKQAENQPKLLEILKNAGIL